MELPSDVGLYAEKDYWEERYKEEECYDWFASYSSFKDIISQTVNNDDRILMLGCGNSTLSEEMYRDGYHNIVNIDYSQVVIDNMTRKCRHLVGMTWKVMDINHLEFEDGEFDVILEKGTLDALLVDEKDPWYTSDEALAQMHHIISQISNKLSPTGKFISITFAQPHFRKPLYAKVAYDWSIQVHTFGETFHFFCYTMVKGQALSDKERVIRENYTTPKPSTNSIRFVENDSDDENFLWKIEDIFS